MHVDLPGKNPKRDCLITNDPLFFLQQYFLKYFLNNTSIMRTVFTVTAK